MENNELLELYWEHLKAPVYYNNKVRPRLHALPHWQAQQERLSQKPNITLNLPGEHWPEYPDNTNIWLWSDLHFNHKNVISFSDRPFSDVDTMNHQLIHNFNAVVGRNDISIWVGDIGFGPDEGTNELLDYCNGYKILVYGNHDFNHERPRKLVFNEHHMLYTLNFIDGLSLVLTHYPMYNLPKEYINVHGHIHKGSKYEHNNDYNSVQHINVNCEFINYQPINLTEVVRVAKSRLLELEG